MENHILKHLAKFHRNPMKCLEVISKNVVFKPFLPLIPYNPTNPFIANKKKVPRNSPNDIKVSFYS